MAVNRYEKNTSSGRGYDNYSSPQGQGQSFLGRTIQIKGEISSNEHLTVEGKVIGNIASSSRLTIGRDGLVNGEINAQAVRIDGKAEGSIIAKQKLEISSAGAFTGNLKSDKLVVEEGAIFQGKVNLEDS